MADERYVKPAARPGSACDGPTAAANCSGRAGIPLPSSRRGLLPTLSRNPGAKYKLKHGEGTVRAATLRRYRAQGAPLAPRLFETLSSTPAEVTASKSSPQHLATGFIHSVADDACAIGTVFPDRSFFSCEKNALPGSTRKRPARSRLNTDPGAGTHTHTRTHKPQGKHTHTSGGGARQKGVSVPFFSLFLLVVFYGQDRLTVARQLCATFRAEEWRLRQRLIATGRLRRRRASNGSEVNRPGAFKESYQQP